MSKVNLNDILTLDGVIGATNANNDLIEAGFDNTLSRDGTSPNTMGADLDMNSNHILNLPAPLSATEPLRLQDLADFLDGTSGVSGVTGPASSVDRELVLFSGTGGNVLEAETGTGFIQTVAGVVQTPSPAIVATDGTFSGNVSGVNGTFTGPLSATTGSFSDGTDATTTTSASLRTVGGLAVGKAAIINGLITQGTTPDAGRGFYQTITVDNSTVGTAAGAYFNSTVKPADTFAATGLRSGMTVDTDSVNVVPTAEALRAGTIVKSGTGTITEARAVRVEMPTVGTTNVGISLAAGAATTAPIQMSAGTNLTTPAAGVLEYDGTVFYNTPAASARGLSVTSHYRFAAADFVGANALGAQNIFDTPSSLTLEAGKTYEIEAMYFIIRTAGATSHTNAFGFGGTATITHASIQYAGNTSATGALAAGSIVGANTLASTVLTAASVAPAEELWVIVKGVIKVNAAGTIIPQFSYSAAPGGAPTIKAGTYIKVTPLSTGTTASIGNWS